MFSKLFLDHPRSVGEGYLEHMRAATFLSFSLIGAGVACLIHALVPRLFADTGSKTVASLHARLLHRSGKREGAGSAGPRKEP